MVVERAPGQSVEQLLQTFRADPDVLYAEPNYIVRTNATPNDPMYPQVYSMGAISAPAAWNVRTGNTSAVIGVIDSGVDYNHPDLAANIWSAPSGFSVTVGGVTVTCAAGSPASTPSPGRAIRWTTTITARIPPERLAPAATMALASPASTGRHASWR